MAWRVPLTFVANPVVRASAPAPAVYFLVVQGHLTFARANLQLDASFIFVMGGSFTVGTEEAPFLQEAQITLHGSPVSKELPLYGAKVLACRRCTLDLHGKPMAHTWTRLNQTAAAGATSMCFMDPVGWAAGSQLVITSTGFDMNEAEQRTIAYVTDGGRCVSFDTPLDHEHLGETRRYAGVPVELRAEVGLLSRNVVVQGNDMSPLDRHGGHIMLYSHEGLVRDNTLVGRFSGKRTRLSIPISSSPPALRFDPLTRSARVPCRHRAPVHGAGIPAWALQRALPSERHNRPELRPALLDSSHIQSCSRDPRGPRASRARQRGLRRYGCATTGVSTVQGPFPRSGVSRFPPPRVLTPTVSHPFVRWQATHSSWRMASRPGT